MKMVIAALAASGLVLSVNPEGCTGGGPMPGQDEATPCVVENRTQNSKNQWYVGVQCNQPNGPVQHSSHLLPNNDGRAWPGCQNGAVWPNCKNG